MSRTLKITSSGAQTTLHSFCSQSGCGDGSYPNAGLIQATDGNLYGTTVEGANGLGTVFKITPGGRLTTLHRFCSKRDCTDGAYPQAALVQATDGSFYGTTLEGGAYGAGTVFKIAKTGKLTTLYSFCSQSSCTDGQFPYAALVQATDGNFYGTTSDGGANGNGTIFKISPGGALATLYSFCSQSGCADGAVPYAALIQGTNGSFYGTTSTGGANRAGTVFSLDVGLAPLAETVPASGSVGEAGTILGSDLSDAAHVRFKHTAALTVVSDTEIQAGVPAGATTGFVTVTRQGPRLKSNVQFQVLP